MRERTTPVKLGHQHVNPKGCRPLTLDESARAIEDAMAIIERIGTTGAERTDTVQFAQQWMQTYYPSYA